MALGDIGGFSSGPYPSWAKPGLDEDELMIDRITLIQKGFKFLQIAYG